MGEEVFQLHIALPHLKLNRVFFSCWCTTGSSFPAGEQQGLLFLLVCKRIFFPCWCFTGSSFPAGDSQGVLSLLVIHRVIFPCWRFTGSSFPAGTLQISYFKILPWQPKTRGPRVAHLSDIATADMQMLCNIFPILSLQLIKRSTFKQFLILKKNIIYGMTVNGA